MSQFTNKADVITGGSSGIGLAVAREPINSLIVISPREMPRWRGFRGCTGRPGSWRKTPHILMKDLVLLLHQSTC
jgi:hypothetical protein